MVVPGHVEYAAAVNGYADAVVGVFGISLVPSLVNLPICSAKLSLCQNHVAVLTIENGILGV